ncbi:MAG: hypothetical protein WBQ72_22860 [Terriglobales bacterium]|jgi:hypothetical protein
MFATIFVAVLSALIVNDWRRNMHKTIKGWTKDAEARAAEHNRDASLYRDRGNEEMTKMHIENYIHWTKSAKRCRMWDFLLP